MSRTSAVFIALFAGCLALAFVGRRRIAHKVDRVLDIAGISTSASAAPAPGPRGTLDVHAHPAGPHPRILLTPERMARVATLGNTPARQALFKVCDQFRREDVTSGYMGWDWVDGILDLALCAKLAKDPEYAATGVRYFKALLDDRFKLGDGQGGDTVVRHDDGYPMRTFGGLGAVAYDWLHDAPGMTPELRKKAVDRFVSWANWYKEKGWEKDRPIANYYAGYFAEVAFGGIACEGDDPRCGALREQTQRMWNDEIVPTYRSQLEGGDFPEGWQYGDGTGATFALYADAEHTSHPGAAGGASHNPMLDDLPWLREVVRLRAFQLHPDMKHTYDGGDWPNYPSVAPVHALYAIAVAFPETDIASRQATFLGRLARADGDDWGWLKIFADDPTRAAEDPRVLPASYFSRGSASVFARSSFAPSALWLSFTSEPTLVDSHEHLDSGHFEVIRGSEPLLIDSGEYGSYSSLSHNVVIVDDPLQSPDWETSSAHHDVITYKRNQGPFSDTAHMARYEDGGGYVYALADYASAFNPYGWPGRKDRAVARAEREFLFSRAPVASAGAPETGRLVIYDRFTLSDARFTTTFILHGGLAPQVSGPLARFAKGNSTAWVTTMIPAGGKSTLVDETHNTYSNDRPWFTNKPPEGVTSFRYEVPSPASPSSTERRFLHTIVIGSQNGSGPNPGGPTRIDGDDVDGATIEGEAYLFARGGPADKPARMAYRVPQTATHNIVCDLAPSAAYAVTATPDGDGCKIVIAPGSGKTATANGLLTIDLGGGCSVR